MNDIIGNKTNQFSRILACVLCIPTIAVMFFDWLTITAIDDLKLTLGFLGIWDSDYTLLQIFSFTKRLEQYTGVNTKRLVIAMGVTEILSILSIIILFVVLLIGIPNLMKAFGVVSFVFCSSLFFIFTSSIHIINSKASESFNGQSIQLVQSTACPYIMFILSSILIFVSVFLASQTSEEVNQ
ncbi:MAG: hypothetical protein EOM05_04530 [Clostridia bacterium]|nr:hypothetical protein [Clostridia bacterium]